MALKAKCRFVKKKYRLTNEIKDIQIGVLLHGKEQTTLVKSQEQKLKIPEQRGNQKGHWSAGVKHGGR